MTTEIEKAAQYSIDFLESFLSHAGSGDFPSSSLPFEIESESRQLDAFEIIRKHFEIHYPWLNLKFAGNGRFEFWGLRP